MTPFVGIEIFTGRLASAIRARQPTREAGRSKSGFGVDQRAEDFVGRLQEPGTRVGLMLADFHFYELLGQLDGIGHRLGGFSSRQGEIRYGSTGLVNTLLSGLIRTEARSQKVVDLHGSIPTEDTWPSLKQSRFAGASRMSL